MTPKAGSDKEVHTQLTTKQWIGFGLVVLFGISVLVSLGVWQLERRTWKLQLIEQVNQRIEAPAIAAPEPSAWPALTSRDAYLHVTLQGNFLNDRETLVHAMTEQGLGYWVMTPLQTKDGFVVLINRGFVPTENKNISTRAAGNSESETTITGLLRVTEPAGRMFQKNIPSAEHWYSRDVTAIAEARHLNNVAPYFIDADNTPNTGGLPIGGLTVVTFPNNHLMYALTWFGLAFILLVAACAFIRDRHRERHKTNG